MINFKKCKVKICYKLINFIVYVKIIFSHTFVPLNNHLVLDLFYCIMCVEYSIRN